MNTEQDKSTEFPLEMILSWRRRSLILTSGQLETNHVRGGGVWVAFCSAQLCLEKKKICLCMYVSTHFIEKHVY